MYDILGQSINLLSRFRKFYESLQGRCFFYKALVIFWSCILTPFTQGYTIQAMITCNESMHM